MVPEATTEEYVLVHAGFALQVVSEEDAKETLDLLMQIPMFQEQELGEILEGA
jgi:hydrogenase expression/formation protein HypC